MDEPSSTGCAWLNGAYLAPGEVRLSPLDAGFLQGDGCFETLRTYGGRPWLLEEHLARLHAGAAALGLELPQGLAGVTREVVRRSRLPECTVRITATRGVEGVHTVLVTALPLRTWAARLYDEGAHAGRLWPRPAVGLPGPSVKSTSRQWAVLGKREALARGWDEGLVLDGSGECVAEGTATNVLAVVDGALWTPPTSVCLAGVTRARVLALARREGLRMREEPLPVAVLQGASEVVLSGSLAELVPVTVFEGARVGSGRPGGVWRRLLDAYLEEARAG